MTEYAPCRATTTMNVRLLRRSCCIAVADGYDLVPLQMIWRVIVHSDSLDTLLFQRSTNPEKASPWLWVRKTRDSCPRHLAAGRAGLCRQVRSRSRSRLVSRRAARCEEAGRRQGDGSRGGSAARKVTKSLKTTWYTGRLKIRHQHPCIERLRVPSNLYSIPSN